MIPLILSINRILQKSYLRTVIGFEILDKSGQGRIIVFVAGVIRVDGLMPGWRKRDRYKLSVTRCTFTEKISVCAAGGNHLQIQSNLSGQNPDGAAI